MELPDDQNSQKTVESCMKQHLSHLTLSRFRVMVQPDGQKSNEYEYSFLTQNPEYGSIVKEQLEKIVGVRVTRISFDDGTQSAGNN